LQCRTFNNQNSHCCRVLGSEITSRKTTVDELSARLATALYLLNQLDAMTSRAEVDSRRTMTSSAQLRDELTRLRRNMSRVSDVTRDTRSRAHDFRVSTHTHTHAY